MREEDTQTVMAEQDTEITLGTGKMLLLFFGLVALCSAFFGLGFKLGKSSGGSVELTTPPSNTATAGGARPSTKPVTTPAPDASRPVGQETTPTQPTSPDSSAKTGDDAASNGGAAGSQPEAPNLTGNSYFVQVAAVTKQEDADALVDALKKKSYTAFASTQADKLIHVQVGPFTDIKDAEATRAKLVGDGYNPILKK